MDGRNHQRPGLSRTPSFTVTPEAYSPASDIHKSVALPPISADVLMIAGDGDDDDVDATSDEVDELVSDIEENGRELPHTAGEVDQDFAEPTESEINMSAIRTTRPGRIERILGRTLVPQSHLDRILQAEGGTGSLAMSKEATFLVSIATEEFIKFLARAGLRESFSDQTYNAISYRNMASITRFESFSFLRDTMPLPISLAEALRRRDEKAKEVLDGVPSTATPSIMPLPNGPVPNQSLTRPKAKRSAALNGKEKVNGTTSAPPRREGKRDSKGRWSQSAVDVMDDDLGEAEAVHIPSSSRPSRASRHERPHNIHNAHLSSSTTPQIVRSHSPHPSRNDMSLRTLEHLATMPPPPPPQHPISYTNHDAHTHQREATYHRVSFPPAPEWTGVFTGPASGFLHARHASSLGSIAPQNPGRTIYSQDFHPNGSTR